MNTPANQARPTRQPASRLGLLAAISLALAACGGELGPDTQIDPFTSDKATLLDFEFDGELVTDQSASSAAAIENQLMYTIGQLNGDGGVGRLDAVNLSRTWTEQLESGQWRVRYHAVLQVAWPSQRDDALPSTYGFQLPRDLSHAGLARFAAEYGETCVDLWSAHDVSPNNLWYYYRPEASGCELASADITFSDVAVRHSPDNRRDTYPEMDLIWQDDLLRAIIVFGKDVAGSTGFNDFGIAQYGQFNHRMRWSYFGGIKLAPEPADIPQAPDERIPEVTWTGTFEDGRSMAVHAFIIDNPRIPGAHFQARYAELSGDADVVVYNGHAALGDNVRAFARMGEPGPGQYSIVSMMGCDTFAYVDGYMAEQRAALNPDDPEGTRYLDMITNIVPTNPTVLSTAALALVRGVANPAAPQSYQEILQNFEHTHYAVVTGEEDNFYRPE
ncbi:MAG: hypothetical protein JRI23_32975 [Deltaproteobacteria bacterium]|jgi:hypothetical protein|nr:hypothetical protein [Deltaproteobacteria bacterium]MBW2537067.1 hypothetical protein [Deltaproteobacteria bacterium]